MSSNADWYAQRLGQARQQQAPVQQPPQYPATQPRPVGLPPHLAPFAPQRPAQAPQASPTAPPPQQGGYAPQSPAELLAMVQQGLLQGTSYTADGAQVADDGHVAMLAYTAARGGSEVVRTHSTQCPNCFKDTLFTLTEGGKFSKATGRKEFPQQCASCNYPNIQAGSHGGALASAKSSGPAHAARQLPRDHRVTVVPLEGGGTVTFDPPT